MICIKLAITCLSAVLAQDLATPPTLSRDSSVEQVLDALHDRGKDLKDFTADVTLVETDESLGDSTSRSGRAVYQKKPDGDARILVVFDRKREGKKILDQKLEYLLDNGWLTQRDYERKTEIRRQVVRPGEKIDLFKLGDGPFPLPVGQPREDVEKLFQVAKIPPSESDPPDSVHLKLTPRAETPFARKFDSIEIWVDTKNNMPKKIVTLDVGKMTKRATDLSVKGVNMGVKEDDFALESIGPGWNRHEETYSE